MHLWSSSWKLLILRFYFEKEDWFRKVSNWWIGLDCHGFFSQTESKILIRFIYLPHLCLSHLPIRYRIFSGTVWIQLPATFICAKERFCAICFENYVCGTWIDWHFYHSATNTRIIIRDETFHKWVVEVFFQIYIFKNIGAQAAFYCHPIKHCMKTMCWRSIRILSLRQEKA